MFRFFYPTLFVIVHVVVLPTSVRADSSGL